MLIRPSSPKRRPEMGAFVEHALEDRRPHNLREKAYDSFTRYLLAREIGAGQFISQRELVEITGLPLGAIRELIPRLAAERLGRTEARRRVARTPFWWKPV